MKAVPMQNLLWVFVFMSCYCRAVALKYDNITLNIYALSWGKTYLEQGIAKFENETGAKISAGWTSSAPFLETQITSDMSSGTNLYDAYICTNKMVPLWASQGWLRDLTDEMREKPELGWAEILPLFRDIVATYAKRVYTVPWDGDVFLTYFRRDLADRDGWPAPSTWTWDDFINIAQKYDGKDLNEDGTPDYGACLASKEQANSVYHWIVPYLTMAQSQGQRQGVFLNLTENGVAPLVDNEAFRKAIDILRASHGSYPKNRVFSDARTDFANGRCAIYFTWPSGGTHSIKTIDANGTKVYVHGRMGVTGLPGSRQVMDWSTGKLAKCTRKTCPYAKDPKTQKYDGINRIAWYANGGMGVAVNAASSAEKQDAAVEFAMWYAKNLDVSKPSPYNPFRENHFDVANYIKSGWDSVDAEQYIDAELTVLKMKNLVLDFRVPGINDFFMDYAEHYLELLEGNQSVVEKSIELITRNLTDFIDSFGKYVKNPQLPGPLELERIYREGIGLPMRSVPETCKPGTGYVEIDAELGTGKTGKCVNCSAGFWGPGGDNQVCLPCAAGSYESSTGSIECSKCPAGTYSTIGQTKCTACPEGTAPGLAGQATCPCKQGWYGRNSKCTPCVSPLTTELVGSSDKSACVCPDSFYKPITQETSPCLPCGEGLVCTRNSLEANIPKSSNMSIAGMVGSYPKVMPSYFTRYSAPLATYACLSEKACPGGRPETCGPHRVGLACGACEKGHFMLDGECRKCSWIAESNILFPIIPAVVGPLLAALLYRNGRKDVELWQTPSAALTHVLVLCLAFTQTSAVLRSFYSVTSGDLDQSWSWTTFTLDILSIARIECRTLTSFSSAFIGKILLPVFFAIVFAVTWAVSRPTCWRMDGNIVFSSYGIMFNAIYISIAAQAFSLFQCYDHPDGRGSSLRSAPDVLCHESEWNSLVAVAIAAILVFCVFSIALYSFVIWICLDYVRQKSFRMRWKFLLAKFRPTSVKWSVILLLKGLWINLSSVIFRTPERQIMWLSFGILLYFAGTLHVKPWRISEIASLDVAVHGLLMVVFCMYPFLVEAPSNNVSQVDSLVIVVYHFGYAACVCFAGFLMFKICVWQRPKNWEQSSQDLSAIFERVGGREDWLIEIFQRVPWIEAQNMLRLAQVLESEMRGGQHGSLVGTDQFRPGKLDQLMEKSGSMVRTLTNGSLSSKRSESGNHHSESSAKDSNQGDRCSEALPECSQDVVPDTRSTDGNSASSAGASRDQKVPYGEEEEDAHFAASINSAKVTSGEDEKTTYI